MIHVDRLRHVYDGVRVLDLPAFEVAQGGRALVLGRSGSGKTTLLHALAGLLRPTEGRVVVAEQDVGALAGDALDRWRGRTVGVVFQRLHLFETLTVRQNLLAAQYLAGLPQDRPRVDEVLGRLDVLGRAGAFPATLSQGQRQRVVIGRAVVNRPRVLLADEPTASLDDDRAAGVLDLLFREADAAGATLLVATHDARAKARFADALVLDAARAAPPAPAAP